MQAELGNARIAEVSLYILFVMYWVAFVGFLTK